LPDRSTLFETTVAISYRHQLSTINWLIIIHLQRITSQAARTVRHQFVRVSDSSPRQRVQSWSPRSGGAKEHNPRLRSVLLLYLGTAKLSGSCSCLVRPRR